MKFISALFVIAVLVFASKGGFPTITLASSSWQDFGNTNLNPPLSNQSGALTLVHSRRVRLVRWRLRFHNE